MEKNDSVMIWFGSEMSPEAGMLKACSLASDSIRGGGGKPFISGGS